GLLLPPRVQLPVATPTLVLTTLRLLDVLLFLDRHLVRLSGEEVGTALVQAGECFIAPIDDDDVAGLEQRVTVWVPDVAAVATLDPQDIQPLVAQPQLREGATLHRVVLRDLHFADAVLPGEVEKTRVVAHIQSRPALQCARNDEGEPPIDDLTVRQHQDDEHPQGEQADPRPQSESLLTSYRKAQD